MPQLPARPAQRPASGDRSRGSAGAATAPGRPPVPWFLWLAALVVLALVGSLAWAAGGGARAIVGGAEGAADAIPAKVDGDVRQTPASPAAAEAFRSCTISSLTDSPAALEFHGYAVDSTTGELLFDDRGEQGTPTASVMKLLTSAAALSVLGPDYRIPTRVYAGAEPGTVVVVGGGDVTLNSMAPGIPSYYDGATGFLSDLAQQVKTAWANDPELSKTPIIRLQVDTSLFGGAEWQPSWLDADRTDGYIGAMSSFMVNGDRQTPTSKDSPRSLAPAQNAANAFAPMLGLTPAQVQLQGTAPAGAKLLAEVQSQPVRELVQYVLRDSDNTLAEALARLTAIQQGTGNAFESIHPSTTAALRNLGLDTSELRLADGSGLSADSRVPPRFVVQLLRVIAGGSSNLQPILDALPANAVSGTLQGRLGDVPAGAIRAKTGWINEVYSLAGYMNLPSGGQLTFAFFVVGTVQPANREQLDAISAAAYRCGEQLADW